MLRVWNTSSRIILILFIVTDAASQDLVLGAGCSFCCSGEFYYIFITHSHLCYLRVHVVSGGALACVNDMFINTTMKIRFKMAVSGVGGG